MTNDIQEQEKQLSLFDFEETEQVKESSKVKIITAADMFEPFYLKSYIPMKIDEKRVDAIKSVVKERLHDDPRKRIEFNNLSLVAKWRVIPKYKTDYTGLNELLYDHGLFQLINFPTKGLSINIKEELEPFKLPTEHYVVPNVNTKKGKEKMAEQDEVFDVERFETDNLLVMFNRFSDNKNWLEEEYKALKNEMILCPILNKKKKLVFEYGSIGLREKHMGYDMDTIIDFLGVDYVLAYGRPDMQALEYFVDRGIVKRKEVDKFRTEIDRRLDFLILTKESEDKQFEIYQSKLQRRSILSMNG